MRSIGLTGGIASGKSTVSRWLKGQGAAIIDADLVAREVVEPGTPGLAQVAQRFPGVLKPDGQLDRAALGARVFSDEEARQALNAIVHPLVRAAMLERAAALAAAGTPRAFFDVPLLFENGLHLGMQDVLLVWVPRAVQRERLMARDHCTAEAADARIAAQWPLDDKRALATWVVDNSGTPQATVAQLERLWPEESSRGLSRSLGYAAAP